MKVRAIGQPMYYARRMREIGEEYEMDDREWDQARILAALGKIEIVEHAKADTSRVAEPPPTYQAAALKTQDEQTEGEGATEAEPMTTENSGPVSAVSMSERKRYYRRRDMKAET